MIDKIRILGIDPGTAITGYGLVDNIKSGPCIVDYGAIYTTPRETDSQRLVDLYNQLNKIIDDYSPDVIAIEKLFFTKNQTTALAVGRASGIMLLCAAQKLIPVFEYSPPEVKQSVVGYGNAEKKQVQYMIQRILKLKEIPKPDDAADALALCICHSHSVKLKYINI